MRCSCSLLRAYNVHYHNLTRSLLGSSNGYASKTSSEFPNLFPPPSRPSNNQSNFDNSKLDSFRGTIDSPFMFKPSSRIAFSDSESDFFESGDSHFRPSFLDFDLPEGEADHGDPWTNYVEYYKRLKKKKQLEEAKIFATPEEALQQWNRLRLEKAHPNLSAVKWSLIAVAGCRLEAPSIMADFVKRLFKAYKYSPRTLKSMVQNILSQLVYPDNADVRFLDVPEFYNLTRAWTPNSKYKKKNDLEDSFRQNMDALIIAIFKEYCTKFPETVSSQLSSGLILHITNIAMRRRSNDLLLQGPLMPTFIKRLQGIKPTTTLAFPSLSPTSTIISPPVAVFLLYRFIQRLLNMGFEKEAFQIFKDVVQAGFISSNAISKVKLDSGDVREMISFAMFQSCLDYEWITASLDLLLVAADTRLARRVAMSDVTQGLVNEAVYLVLKKSSLISFGPTFGSTLRESSLSYQSDRGAAYLLDRCLELIQKLRHTDKDFWLDDKVIQKFYELAQKIQAGTAAEMLYSIGRSQFDSRSETPSPPPPSPLLRSATFSKAPPTSASFVSATEPRFITSTPEAPVLDDSPDPASLEPLTWPQLGMYPPPQGPPLTWLMSYMALYSKNVHCARCLATEVADRELDLSLLDGSRFLWLTANCGFAEAARKIWLRYSGHRNNGIVGHAGSMVRIVGLFSHMIQKAMNEEASSLRQKEAESDDPLIPKIFDAPVPPKESSEELRQFAEKVINYFRRAKEPIKNASHQDLNALARAYFMMGKVTEGFDVFRIVLDRKDIPDLYDVNVALSGLAKNSPKIACEMLDKMLRRGLIPDAAAFGTVIYEAMIRGDNELMASLVQKAREADAGKLTSKTIASLIRASIAITDTMDDNPRDGERRTIMLRLGTDGTEGQLVIGGKADIEQVEANLKTAWELMQIMNTKADAIGLPNLGENCLVAALRIGEAELAFKYWEAFLKNKTQWSDPEQMRLRWRIAKLAQTSQTLGRLDSNKARIIIRQVQPGVYHRKNTI